MLHNNVVAPRERSLGLLDGRLHLRGRATFDVAEHHIVSVGISSPGQGRETREEERHHVETYSHVRYTTADAVHLSAAAAKSPPILEIALLILRAPTISGLRP